MEDAKNKIIKYLASSDKSSYQVRQKLSDYGCSDILAEEILEFLIEYGYVDDERFAQQFIQDELNLKHHGKIKIRYELQKRKVPEEIIQSQMEKFSDEDEVKSAYEIILTKFSVARIQPAEDEKKKDFLKRNLFKLKDLLSRRGYSFNVINALFDRFGEEYL